MFSVTTQGERNLKKTVRCSWARVVWYQPGAAMQINNGALVPLTRRGYVFPALVDLTITGRAYLECGTNNYPGASDIERRGPGFVWQITFSSGSAVLIPVQRNVRVEYVSVDAWNVPAALAGNAQSSQLSISGYLFLKSAADALAFNDQINPLDADDPANRFTPNPTVAPGVVKLSLLGIQNLTAPQFSALTAPSVVGLSWGTLIAPHNGVNSDFIPPPIVFPAGAGPLLTVPSTEANGSGGPNSAGVGSCLAIGGFANGGSIAVTVRGYEEFI